VLCINEDNGNTRSGRAAGEIWESVISVIVLLLVEVDGCRGQWPRASWTTLTTTKADATSR
jgi:hypothetical protein